MYAQNTLASGSPYGAATPQTVNQDPTAMQTILADLDKKLGLAGLLSDRLMRFNARTWGTAPVEGKDAGPRPVPNGALAQISEKLQWIDNYLTEIGAAVDILDKLG